MTSASLRMPIRLFPLVAPPHLAHLKQHDIAQRRLLRLSSHYPNCGFNTYGLWLVDVPLTQSSKQIPVTPCPSHLRWNPPPSRRRYAVNSKFRQVSTGSPSHALGYALGVLNIDAGEKSFPSYFAICFGQRLA